MVRASLEGAYNLHPLSGGGGAETEKNRFCYLIRFYLSTSVFCTAAIRYYRPKLTTKIRLSCIAAEEVPEFAGLLLVPTPKSTQHDTSNSHLPGRTSSAVNKMLKNFSLQFKFIFSLSLLVKLVVYELWKQNSQYFALGMIEVFETN